MSITTKSGFVLRRTAGNGTTHWYEYLCHPHSAVMVTTNPTEAMIFDNLGSGITAMRERLDYMGIDSTAFMSVGVKVTHEFDY